MTHSITCPCCKGAGTSSPYLASGCHVCESTGAIKTEVFGDANNFAFPEEPNSLLETHICEEVPEIAEAVWEWVTVHYKDQDWWKVHGQFPALEAIESILLDNGIISIIDIPGGPNNPDAQRHIKDADAYLKTLIKKNPGKKMSRPTSYREGLKQQLKEEIKREAEAHSSSPPNHGETKMNKTPVDKLKSGARIAGDAIKEGAAIGTVTAANSAAIDYLEFKMGDKWPEALKTPHGRAAVELMVPLIVTLLLEFDEQDRIPGKQKIQLAAQYALKGTSSDAVQKVTELLLRHGGLLLQAYTEAGEQLAESHQLSEGVEDFADVIEKMQVQEAVEVGSKA